MLMRTTLCCWWLGIVLALYLVNGHAEEMPWERIAFEDRDSGFRFPQMIAPYEYVQNQDYGPRMGTGVHYMELTGTKASIYFYTKELNDLRDGTSEPRLKDELQAIEEGFSEMIRRGEYASVRRVDPTQPLSKAWLQTNHEIQLRDGTVLKSYSFLRVQNGRFVKIRISGTSEGSYARLPTFLLGVMRGIGMLGAQPARNQGEH